MAGALTNSEEALIIAFNGEENGNFEHLQGDGPQEVEEGPEIEDAFEEVEDPVRPGSNSSGVASSGSREFVTTPEDGPDYDYNDEGYEEEAEEDEDGNAEYLFKRSRGPQERRDAPKRRDITSACSKASAASSMRKKMQDEERKLMEKRAARPDDPLNPNWLRGYAKHVERVMSAQPKIDTSPPVVTKSYYSSPSSFNKSLENFSRIERENAMLLHRIATIFQGRGEVDCRHKGGEVSKHRNPQAEITRRQELLRITFDNLALVKKIKDVRSVYDRKEQLKEFQRREEIMQRNSYFPLFWKVKKAQIWDDLESQVLQNACANPRPRIFLDIRAGRKGLFLGRVILELRADIVPYTVENFRHLCTSEDFGFSCCTFYRVYPGLFWQGGENLVDPATNRDRKSLFGGFFPDENFKLRHDRPGAISMANEGVPHTNGSHFIITESSLPPLDDKNVVFGYVVAGLGALKKMNQYAQKGVRSGKPNRKIWISSAGELIPGGDLSLYQDEEDERWLSKATSTTSVATGASRPISARSRGQEPPGELKSVEEMLLDDEGGVQINFPQSSMNIQMEMGRGSRVKGQ